MRETDDKNSITFVASRIKYAIKPKNTECLEKGYTCKKNKRSLLCFEFFFKITECEF